MNVLIIRHAVAEDRQEFGRTGKPDDERPLTRDGRDKMRQISLALSAVVPNLDLVASSPLKRAQQTARIVCGAYAELDFVQLETLAPGGSHEGTIDWLASRFNVRCAALVGHEPSLSSLCATLLCPGCDPFFEFKKGGAVLLNFARKPAPGAARMEWAMQPAQLRTIARTVRR